MSSLNWWLHLVWCQDTWDIAPTDAMQFGHAFDRFICEILLSNPSLDTVYLIKADISDGFYRVALRIEDIPKLALAFPALEKQPPLVAPPLCLPMGWKNSPPYFSAATKTTIADLANHHLLHYDEHPPCTQIPLPMSFTGPTSNWVPSGILFIPCNQLLPFKCKQTAYMDVYVDDMTSLLLLRDHHQNFQQVWSIIFQALDSIFCPVDTQDSQY